MSDLDDTTTAHFVEIMTHALYFARACVATSNPIPSQYYVPSPTTQSVRMAVSNSILLPHNITSPKTREWDQFGGANVIVKKNWANIINQLDKAMAGGAAPTFDYVQLWNFVKTAMATIVSPPRFVTTTNRPLVIMEYLGDDKAKVTKTYMYTWDMTTTTTTTTTPNRQMCNLVDYARVHGWITTLVAHFPTARGNLNPMALYAHRTPGERASLLRAEYNARCVALARNTQMPTKLSAALAKQDYGVTAEQMVLLSQMFPIANELAYVEMDVFCDVTHIHQEEESLLSDAQIRAEPYLTNKMKSRKYGTTSKK
jgi:hypothetical protein